jgi:GntR family transcriptional regulator
MMTQNEITQIDFSSYIPYYVQLIRLIKGQITSGNWKPGDQIPGEPDLCELYGISRTVVRQALRELEIEGLVIRRKGRGTFVAQPKLNESLVQKLTGFYEDMVARGHTPVTRTLNHSVVPATDKIAQWLEIAPGAKVFDIQRLRSIDDTPFQLVSSYLPFDLCPQLENVDLTNRSLYNFLENECGLVIARGRRYIEAVAANETEARLLEIERGAPLVMLDSISFLDTGRPIEFFHAVHRGDRARFEVELVRLHSHEQSMPNKSELPDSNSQFRK